MTTSTVTSDAGVGLRGWVIPMPGYAWHALLLGGPTLQEDPSLEARKKVARDVGGAVALAVDATRLAVSEAIYSERKWW